ncbi:MAG: hypothetical protein RMM06_09000 [Armatimonadota bacterium]|nr:hypothetical protein [Armatimonadota bacterium]
MKNKEVPAWLAIGVIVVLVAAVMYFYWYTTTPHPRTPPPGVRPVPIAPGATDGAAPVPVGR